MNIYRVVWGSILTAIVAFFILWLIFPLSVILFIEKDIEFFQSSDFLVRLLPLMFLFALLIFAILNGPKVYQQLNKR